LQGLAGYALRTERSAEAPILLCMAIDHGYSFPAEVLTPMGPRDRAWLERVSVKPDEGSDFFAWWERGGGPRSLRDRALAHMWTDVCWRPPVDEDELLLQERVVELLARAHAGDPTLDFPWREWNELLDHVGTDDDDLAELVAARAGEVRGPRIGYRRHPVTVHVGSGWSIRIPGALRERWEDDSTWLAYDETHTVRLTTFAVGDDAASPEEVLERMERPAGELIEHRTDGLLGWATLDTERDEDGEHLLLQGYTAVAGGLALTTIVVPDAAHVGWAVDTWRSVRGPAPTPPAD